MVFGYGFYDTRIEIRIRRGIRWNGKQTYVQRRGFTGFDDLFEIK